MSKLDPKANKYLFFGYSPTQKGYKCYSPAIKKFYVTFLENQPFFTKNNIQGGTYKNVIFGFKKFPKLNLVLQLTNLYLIYLNLSFLKLLLNKLSLQPLNLSQLFLPLLLHNMQITLSYMFIQGGKGLEKN